MTSSFHDDAIFPHRANQSAVCFGQLCPSENLATSRQKLLGPATARDYTLIIDYLSGVGRLAFIFCCRTVKAES